MGIFDRLKNAVKSRVQTIKNVIAPPKPTPPPVFTNRVSPQLQAKANSQYEDPKAVFRKSFAQNLGRNAVELGKSVLRAPFRAIAYGVSNIRPDSRAKGEFKPEDTIAPKAARFLLGPEPIRPFKQAQQTAVEQTAGLAGKVGIKDTPLLRKIISPIAAVGAIALPAADLTGLGGLAKKGVAEGTIKQLVKNTTVREVEETLAKQGVKLSARAIEDIAKTTDSKAIKTIVSSSLERQVAETAAKKGEKVGPFKKTTKQPTYAEAEKLIEKEGGFTGAKSLPATNRYAADELASSLRLNKKFLYEQATARGIRLADELATFDKLRGEGGDVAKFATDLVAKLSEPTKVATGAETVGSAGLKALRDKHPLLQGKATEEVVAKKSVAETNLTKPNPQTAAELEQAGLPPVVEKEVPRITPAAVDSIPEPEIQAPPKPAEKQISEILDPAAQKGAKPLADQGIDAAQTPDPLKGAKPVADTKEADEAVRAEVAKNVEVKKKDLERLLYGEPTEIKTGGKGAGFIGSKTRALQEAASRKVAEGLQSENPVVRNLAAGLRGFFGQSGNVAEQAKELRRVRGAEASSIQIANDLDALVRETVGNNEESLKRLHAVLDPDISKLSVKEADLTAEEAKALATLRQTSDYINDQNFANGFISKQTWEQGKDGKYIARAYDEYDLPPELKDTEAFKANKGQLDLSSFKKRKDIDEWKLDHAIDDPSYLAAKRLQQTVRNSEIKKYADWVASRSDMISDAPRAGYTTLSDSPMWGALAGKNVRQDVLEGIKGFYSDNKAVQGLLDVLNWYDRLAPRRFLKKTKTVYNPAVRLGNQFGNRTFALLNGINPFAFEKNIQFYAKKAIKENDPLVRILRENGIIGSDYTRKELVNTLGEVGKGSVKKNAFKKAEQFITESYSGADDTAKVAAAKYWIDKGKSLEEAIQKVQRGFQDYNTVGKFYDIGAKIPVFGNAFVRFQGDLIRILKNAALENPLAVAGTAGAIYFAGKLFSKMSGESEEDYQTRTTRVGSPVIPYTKIPLAFQTPWGEVNAARLFGIYSLTPTGGESGVGNQLSRQLPIQIPTNKRELGAGLTSDPLIGPVIGTAANIDYRGKSVRDPNENQYQPSTLTPGEQNTNRAAYLARSYNLPFFNDVLNVYRASKGQKSVYDTEMSTGQAVARLGGVKFQQFGPEQAKEVRDRNQSFADSANEAIQKQINQVIKDQLSGKIDESTAQKRIDNLRKKGGSYKATDASGIRETDEGFKYIYNGKLLTADTREDAELGLEKEKFRASGQKFQIIGDKVYSRDNAGKIKSTKLVDYIGAEYDYRLAAAKNDKDYEAYGLAAGQYMQELNKLAKNAKTNEAKLDILGEQKTLLSDYYKTSKSKDGAALFIAKATEMNSLIEKMKADPDLTKDQYYKLATEQEKLQSQVKTAAKFKGGGGKGRKKVKQIKLRRGSPNSSALKGISKRRAKNPFKKKSTKIRLATLPSTKSINPFKSTRI